jgi:tRNA-dihydrouridine synthase
MQDVTNLEFWRVIARYGGPDVYWTEYFRVHPTYQLEKYILRSITQNPTGRPVIAQLIGNDIPSLVRAAEQLQRHPVAAIDLNLGCPAPVVYRKCAGGGLLRTPEKVDAILGALREVVHVPFTVKTRIGFDSPEVFERLLPIFARHSLDLVTVHARTVKEMYWSEVHYEYIGRAAAALPCPVLANGNVYSAAKALEVLQQTGACGLMIGRGAIRNPWMFDQIRAALKGEQPVYPTGHQVLEYVQLLFEAICAPELRESSQVQRMKKFVNFIGLGVDPEGSFLHRMRRTTKRDEFFGLCREFLEHNRPMTLEPYKLGLAETDVLAGEHH